MIKHIARYLCSAALFLSACTKEEDTDYYDDGLIYLTNHNTGYRTYFLPDSTMLLLNAGSYLHYARDSFNRTIDLYGSAIIYVRDTAQDFTVNYEHIAARTKNGTFTFNSRLAYNTSYGAPQPLVPVRVSVVKGKVEVTNETGTAKLRTGDAVDVMYDDISSRINWDKEEEISWKDGYYNFKNIEMWDLCNLLQKQYDVTVSYFVTETNYMLHDIHLDLTQNKDELPYDFDLGQKINIMSFGTGDDLYWRVSVRK